MTSRPIRKLTPRARDQFQVLTAAATGFAAFGTLVGTGLVTGHVSAAFAAQTKARTTATEAPPTPAVVTKRRPHRTVVRTVVVERSTSGRVAAPATGGTIRSGVTRTVRSGSGSGSTAPSHPAAAPKPAPKPAPAPAPSSGS